MCRKWQLFIILVLQALTIKAAQSDLVIQFHGTKVPPISQAEILGYNQGTTTVKLFCNPDSTAPECGPLPQNVYILGPGILKTQGSLAGEYTFYENCSSTATTAATCKDFESAANAIFSSSTVTSYTTSYITTYGPAEIATLTVPIVQGADLLPNTTSASRATPAPGMSSMSSTPTPTQTSSSGAAVETPLRLRTLAAAYCIAILYST